MVTNIKTSTNTRLFVAIPVPPKITDTLKKSFDHFPSYINTKVPAEKWHITLAWLGEPENPQQYISRLAKPIPQSFVPTIHLTHVGRGLQRSHLWAFAYRSNMLTNIREEMIFRLRKMRYKFPANTPEKFAPHITMANFLPNTGGIGLPDHPLNASFSFKSANIYLSKLTPAGSEYDHVATINLAT